MQKQFQLDLLILFGSRAKNKAKKNSDYDIAFLKKNIKIDKEMSIFEEVENIIQNGNLDLINLEKNHNIILRQNIFQKGYLLHEKQEQLFNKHKEKTFFDYIDSLELLQPTKEKYLASKL